MKNSQENVKSDRSVMTDHRCSSSLAFCSSAALKACKSVKITHKLTLEIARQAFVNL